MTSALRPRFAAAVLLLAIAATLWLLLRPGRGTEREGPAGTARAAEPASGAAIMDAARSGAHAEPGMSRNPVAPDDPGSAESAAAGVGPPVHLRVLLRVTDEDGEERIPANCAGWVVRAQSWIEETHEVFPHEARADARGVAEFTFPGFVHVDWVGCAPPLASGLGFSQVSGHDDFDAGSEEEWTLLLAAGGGARGRIEQLDGRPAAGAVVHAFDTGWPGTADTWYPGFLQTRASDGGVFEFAALGEGDWCFAVEPGIWMQVQPTIGDYGEGAGFVSLVPGETVDAGVLRVTRADELRIRVSDAEGDGVAGVEFALIAERFAVPGLQTAGWAVEEEYEEPDWLDRFLAGEDPENWLSPSQPAASAVGAEAGPEWPYDGYSQTTGADGECAFRVPPGRYRVECWSALPGIPPERLEELAADVPGPPIEIRLPLNCHDWSGQVVDGSGVPVDAPELSLQWDEGGAWYADGDATGRFEFHDVPDLRDCWLVGEAAGYVATRWRVSLAEPPAAPFCLPAGENLWVEFRDPDGEPAELEGAFVDLRPLRVATPAAAPGTIAGEPDVHGFGTGLYGSRVYAAGLPAGEYELTLALRQFHPVSPNTTFLSGVMELSSFAESVELGRWQVTTGAGKQILQLDRETMARIHPEARRYRGRIVDAVSGEGIPEAMVSAAGVGVRASISTDVDGGFEVEIAGSAISLTFSADGYEQRTLGEGDFPPEDAEFRVALERAGATVHLRLLDRDGRRLPPCTATIVLPAAGGGEQRLEDLELLDGEVWFQAKQPGVARVTLRIGALARAEGSFSLASAEGSYAVDCRVDKTLAELRAALRLPH